MRSPDSTQVPLYEPIYINGHMSNVWVMFFQKLARIANDADTGDLLTLVQLANQLPSNAQQGQTAFDIAELQNAFSAVPLHISQDVEIPPATAVFLCQQEVMPLVTPPSLEIIYDQVQEPIQTEDAT